MVLKPLILVTLNEAEQGSFLKVTSNSQARKCRKRQEEKSNCMWYVNCPVPTFLLLPPSRVENMLSETTLKRLTILNYWIGNGQGYHLVLPLWQDYVRFARSSCRGNNEHCSPLQAETHPSPPQHKRSRPVSKLSLLPQSQVKERVNNNHVNVVQSVCAWNRRASVKTKSQVRQSQPVVTYGKQIYFEWLFAV